MTVTVTGKNYTLINACEDSAQWTGGNADDVTAFFKEGTQCVGFELWSSGNLDIYITGSWDLSGTKHLRCWMMTTVLNELNTDANGGVQFYVSDGTNTGYYYVSGSTTYPGGWYNLVIDLSRAVDSGTKPTMTAITTIGLRFNLTVAAKKVQSLWIDHLYHGDGLVAYGDDAGSPFDFDNVLAADENTSNGWGIIRKISGVYYLVGSITLGDGAGTNSCDFEDKNQIIIFENRKVNSALYEISVVGNATGTTSFKIGEKSGTAGISGCTIKSISTSLAFKLTATDTDVATLGLYGSTFDTHGLSDLMINAANREVLNCNFTSGQGQFQPNTITVENCSFISCSSAIDAAVLLEFITHNMKNNSYINNPDAIEIETADTYVLDGDTFTGNTYDFNNTSGSSATVQNTNGANAGTYEGSTVNFETTVYLRLYVKDEAGNPINLAQCAVYKSSDDSQLMNEDTDANGLAEETFNYVSDTDIYWRVRKSSSGTTRYFPAKGTGTIGSGGFTAYVTLVEDAIAEP